MWRGPRLGCAGLRAAQQPAPPAAPILQPRPQLPAPGRCPPSTHPCAFHQSAPPAPPTATPTDQSREPHAGDQWGELLPAPISGQAEIRGGEKGGTGAAEGRGQPRLWAALGREAGSARRRVSSAGQSGAYANRSGKPRPRGCEGVAVVAWGWGRFGPRLFGRSAVPSRDQDRPRSATCSEQPERHRERGPGAGWRCGGLRRGLSLPLPWPPSASFGSALRVGRSDESGFLGSMLMHGDGGCHQQSGRAAICGGRQPGYAPPLRLGAALRFLVRVLFQPQRCACRLWRLCVKRRVASF